MLEHSAMYLNVTPPYEEEPTFFPDLYSRIPGPCELQDPVWSKMNLGGQVNKKRKKSDNKPQAQLNKCNNEKRRREQENIYIEELAELISANFADMSSFAVKPDKCAILQETVKQIRRIKQQEVANEQNPDPVQQGEVSSSKPSILSNEVYGPLLLEALEGFLFVISNDGKVEHVTENVADYIIYTKEEMVGKTIYNFLHPGDHTKFASTLLPMSIEWGNDQTPPRSKSIDVRLLVKDQNEDSGEEKRQGATCYELMHISSTQLRDNFSMSSDDDSSDSGPCLLCVASRISQRDKASCSFEQFTTKLDPLGKILDTSGVTDATSQALRTDLKNKIISQLVPAQDVHKVSAHLKETMTTGQAVSQVYRIQVAPDKFVQVQTKSKLFKTNTLNQSNDGDFIMATHTIIAENDSLGPGDPGGGSSASGSSIGGPLMTSVLTNGTAGGPGGQAATATRNGTISSAASDISQSTNSSGSLMNSSTPGPGMGGNSVFGPSYLDTDFSIDFPTTTWPDLEANWPEAARPDSRQSITPVSTPTSRPPSQPSYSNAPTAVAQSPMGAHFSAQPSPSLLNHQPGSQQSQSSFNSWMETDFSDQFEQENKDTKENVQQSVEAPSLSDSHRLRSLLTTASTTSMAASQSTQETSSGGNDNRDRILKALLNQQDEDQGGHGGGPSRGDPIMSRGALIPNVETQNKTGGIGNNMLRQLLDKTDDDDKEKMSGLKKPSELLQLLKKDSHDDDDKRNDSHSHGDSLLRSLGFPPGSPDRRGHKRSMDDKDENRDNKRNSSDGQVSSTGSSDSELCKKNKMLASLLAKQTHTPPTIPSVPPSVISALPQEKLPRIATDPAKAIGGTMAQLMNSARRNSTPIGRSFLQANLQRMANQVNSGFAQATSTSDNHINWGENNNIHSASATDTVPAELLEELMDLVPDNNADITLLLDQHKPPQSSSGLSEALAIYTIQKDLMQCETAVKSPTSPNISLPARPPAYPQVPNVNVSTQNNMQGYPPPPNYLQASKYVRVRSGGAAGPQYATASNQQQLMLQRKQLLQQQQQQQHEKQRLLQQQKQQQLLIPSNATNADMNNIQNIDSIMNNTVAPPNVSLQRSSSVPDAQLSPNYSAANSLSQQNQRGQQSQQQNQPYSPLSQMPSPLGGQNFQTQTSVTGSYQSSAARMSPQSQYNAQLSPRQAYPQGNGNPSSGAWPSQRMTIQQNPMLNAQLTRAPQQGNRSLNSPGTGPSRHSPFAGDQFPPPSSPSSQSFTAQAQTQYMQRLQRANSVPTSNSAQMTGGLGSPRSYSGGGHHAPPHYPTAVPQTPPQNPNSMQAAPGIAPPHHMMYQQQGVDSYNCGYDQTPVAYSPDQRGGVRVHQQGSHMQSGVATNPTSEFVRQELRAVVSNRTAQGGGAGQQGVTTAQQQRNAAASQQQSNLLAQQQSVDLEALGINFEIGGASDTKLWAAMASDLVGAALVSPAQQQTSARTTMEEIRQGDHAKTSLLQQLLSDQSK